MIHLMQAMLVKSVRDSPHGHEATDPVNLIWVSDEERSRAPIDFRLQCVALLYVRGGQPNEELTVTGTIRGPNTNPVHFGPCTVVWRDRARVMDIVMGIDAVVKMNDGGLYEIRFQVNHRPLVTLPLYVVWESEKEVV